eukprot:77826_1
MVLYFSTVLILLSSMLLWCKAIDLTLTISTNNIIRTLPERFIGFNLDYWEDNHEHFGNSSIPYINFKNKDLLALTSAVSPAMLRIGGSGEDSVIYNISNECNEPNKWNISGPYYCSEVHPPNYYCLTKTRWQQILQFCQDTNLKLIYGLNACYGRKGKDKPIDMTNIDSLLSYTISQSKNLNISRIEGFEFGNSMSGSITAQTYANDFTKLNSLINKYFKNYTNKIPACIGTDNNYAATGYVQDVLSILKPGVMSIVNWHQYTNCPQEQKYVFSKDCLSTITQYPAIYENILSKTDQTETTLMIGESALHHSGGEDGSSNVFESSFYYTYQLSELAKISDMNIVQRQTLSGGYYGLLDTNFVPMSDYWVIYLWKMFIGNKVLQTSLTNNQNVTGYAYNGKNNKDVTVVLINFSDTVAANVQLHLSGSSNTYKYEEYHMNGPLDSKTAYINNQ